MKLSLRFALGGVLVIAALLAGVAIAAGQSPASVPAVAGYQLPANLDAGHFVLESVPASANQAVSISPDVAVTRARDYAGGLAISPKGVSVQAVLFTDTHRGIQNSDGTITPSFVKVPAYIVRFTGVPQPVFAPPDQPTGPAAQELNVVINSSTGDYVEMFSFQ